MNIKELAEQESKLAPVHRMCAGCAAPIIVRTVLAGTKDPIVAANATGCLEVATTIYPDSAWRIPWMHSAFENAAATCAGIESAYRALKKRGKMKQDVKFVAFGGDGGTYDIGLQSLSGALERGHDFLYVCYDNGAYMNTGGQRSSATPCGAAATTAPAGKVIKGKQEWPKDLLSIVDAHEVPYAAKASVGNIPDLLNKAQKAFETKGPTFLLVFSPCTTLWGFPTSKTTWFAKMATETKLWPLVEIIDGEWKLTYKPSGTQTFKEFMKGQRRFKHLANEEEILDKIQNRIDFEWEKLLKKCGEK